MELSDTDLLDELERLRIEGSLSVGGRGGAEIRVGDRWQRNESTLREAARLSVSLRATSLTPPSVSPVSSGEAKE